MMAGIFDEQDPWGNKADYEECLLGQRNGVYHAQMMAMQDVGNFGLGITGTGLGAAQANQTATALQMMSQQQSLQNIPKAPKENGTLYLKGKELPEDWSGAKITSYKRQMFNADEGFRWQFTFLSKWSDEQRIELYLDAETLSGEEARKIADTYMEALNQRRSG